MPTTTPSIPPFLQQPSASAIPTTVVGLASASHHLSSGAVAGLVLTFLLFAIAISIITYITCRRRTQHRKRFREVGKASRVDLAEAEMNRSTFYSVQGPVVSWLRGAKSAKPASNFDYDYGRDAFPYEPPPIPEEPEPAQLPPSRPSVATFTSTSDSRSQGSMVIGSRAFWNAVEQPPAVGQVTKTFLTIHNPDRNGKS